MYYSLDANECNSVTPVCGQICTNTEGSYECSCNTGYVLNNNGISCDGMYMLNVLGAICVHMCTYTYI